MKHIHEDKKKKKLPKDSLFTANVADKVTKMYQKLIFGWLLNSTLILKYSRPQFSKEPHEMF